MRRTHTTGTGNGRQISSMSTSAGRDGEAVVDVAIRQPMPGLRSCAAQLPYPEQILPEAFEEHSDKLCVCRQLAALHQRPMQAIVDTFSALKEGNEWMRYGLSAEGLRTFCISEGHPFFFASSSRLLLTYEPEQKLGKAIACALHDGRSLLHVSLCSVPGELACQRERDHGLGQAAAGGEEHAPPSVRV